MNQESEQPKLLVNYTIKELTVSPSAPIETGIQISGAGHGGPYYLPFAVSPFHTGAFSRIVLGDVAMSSGDFAMISYKLIVTPNTEPAFFNLRLDNSSFLASNGGLTACTGWTGQLSGYANLIHAGIKLISSSAIPTNQSLPNEFNTSYTKIITSQDDSSNYFGMSYTPLFGAPLEPSTPSGAYVAYVSSDNLQFVASPFGGAIDPTKTGQFFPYNINGIKSSGVCGYLTGLLTSGNQASAYANIRHDSTSLLTPASGNITVPQATVGITGKQIYFPPPTVVAGSKGFSFGWTAQQGFDVASVVLGTYNRQYNTSDTNIYPFFDMVLNTTGQGIMPVPFLKPTTNRTGVYNVNTDGPLFLDGINNITLQFQLTWSS